jgi:hypothetical protein
MGRKVMGKTAAEGVEEEEANAMKMFREEGRSRYHVKMG